IRHRASHHEDTPDVVRLDLASPIVAPADPLELSVAVQRNDLRAGTQDDLGALFDAANQVARHRVRQSVSAAQHVYARRGLREEPGSLSGGIATTDDSDLLVDTELSLHRRRTIVNTGAFKRRKVLERRLAILRAGGDDHRARSYRRSAVNLYGVSLAIA